MGRRHDHAPPDRCGLVRVAGAQHRPNTIHKGIPITQDRQLEGFDCTHTIRLCGCGTCSNVLFLRRRMLLKPGVRRLISESSDIFPAISDLFGHRKTPEKLGFSVCRGLVFVEFQIFRAKRCPVFPGGPDLLVEKEQHNQQPHSK